MNLLELLQAGDVETFNQQRGQRRRVDLFAAELAGANISTADLSGATLEKADLTGADLTDCNVSRADLSGIDGNEMKLLDVMGVGVKLREAILDDAEIAGADFSHGDLAEASLVRTKGPHLRVGSARLREIDATEASWPEADLVEARLHKANFTKADLSKADFTEAIANEANFTDAKLEGIVGARARFQQAIFVRADLGGARLEEADLSGADLTDADLQRADLRRANLTGAKLVGAKLRGAILADAILEGVDFTGIDVRDVDLTGVDPRALGLSDEQLASAAAVGSASAADAPVRVTEAQVARRGDVFAVVWENADTDETMSLRWALLRAGRPTEAGVLPLSAEGVLARAVVAVDDGFAVLVLQERPGGVALLRWSLGEDGAIGTAKVEPLGYDPGVRPIVSVEGATITMRGLSRRGPTLIVQQLGAEGLQTIESRKVATARGFLGRHDAVLACKGGVVMPVGAGFTGEPMRTPSEFPTPVSTAVGHGDRVLAAWVEPARSDEEPGGVRVAWLGKGVTPRPEALTFFADVGAIDAVAHPDGVWLAWTEIAADATASVHVARVPDLEPRRLDLPEDIEVEEVRFVDGAGDVPVLACTTVDERLVVLGIDGRLHGAL